MDIKKDILCVNSIDNLFKVPDIRGHIQTQDDYGDDEISGWFLGTKGENSEVLEKFVHQAIAINHFIRRDFHPEDPTPITEEVKNSKGYLAAMQSLTDNFYRLNSFLSEYGTPFFSMRYQAHMTWETTLPAQIGYFAAMLNNPNNVTMQASTATTLLEWMVGFDICRMVGFVNTPQPWAHITCDGTVANLEAFWATRELRLLPLGIKDALNRDSQFSNVRNKIDVTLPDGVTTEKIIDLDTWQLLNLSQDQILAIPSKIADASNEHFTESDVWTILKNGYSPNALGMVAFTRKYMPNTNLPVVVVPSTRHYSWPKAAYMLGLGIGTSAVSDACQNNFDRQMISICVDQRARMRIDRFKEVVDHCYNQKIPLLLALSVLGTTEESAVDPLEQVLQIRDDYRKKNFDFNIHVDAAWGGYQISTIRKDYDLEWPTTPEKAAKFEEFDDEDSKAPFISDTARVYTNEYTIAQMKKVREADSTTIDPHKCGYIPYPAGCLAYRNGKMKELLKYTAPYISVSASSVNCPASERSKAVSAIDAYSVGQYGVEGSKPGASPASVFLSHSVIRPSVKGYGKVLNRTFLNARMFYIYLTYMAQQYTEQKQFFVEPLQELPTHFYPFVKANIYGKPLREILENPEVREFIKPLGPDQNIFNYIFNFFLDDGTPNRELKWANALNQAIYNKLHITAWEDAKKLDVMITMTTFNRNEYGSQFIDDFASRLKLDTSQTVDKLNCLRSVCMDPWVADTYFNDSTHMNFFQSVVVPTLLSTVQECVEEIKQCISEQ